jgi:hypothetical protein
MTDVALTRKITRLFSLCVFYKEGLCPSSGGINKLMMKLQSIYLIAQNFNLTLINDIISDITNITQIFFQNITLTTPLPRCSGKVNLITMQYDILSLSEACVHKTIETAEDNE